MEKKRKKTEMVVPRKRWKLITLGRVMVLSVALNLQLLQQRSVLSNNSFLPVFYGIVLHKETRGKLFNLASDFLFM